MRHGPYRKTEPPVPMTTPVPFEAVSTPSPCSGRREDAIGPYGQGTTSNGPGLGEEWAHQNARTPPEEQFGLGSRQNLPGLGGERGNTALVGVSVHGGPRPSSQTAAGAPTPSFDQVPSKSLSERRPSVAGGTRRNKKPGNSALRSQRSAPYPAQNAPTTGTSVSTQHRRHPRYKAPPRVYHSIDLCVERVSDRVICHCCDFKRLTKGTSSRGLH